MDCDYSHPPDRIPQMLYMLAQGYDVVVNSRYTVGGGESRSGKGGTLQRWLSGALNWSVRFMLRPSFSDYTSGFVAVRREVLAEIPLRGDYGEYFVDFIFRALRRGPRSQVPGHRWAVALRGALTEDLTSPAPPQAFRGHA
jgi:dolichol-phosphate mannosyltransferase